MLMLSTKVFLTRLLTCQDFSWPIPHHMPPTLSPADGPSIRQHASSWLKGLEVMTKVCLVYRNRPHARAHLRSEKAHVRGGSCFQFASGGPGFRRREWPPQMFLRPSVLRGPLRNVFSVFLIPKIWNKTITNKKELVFTYFFSHWKTENVKKNLMIL